MKSIIFCFAWRLTVKGAYGAHLFVIHEDNTWLPIELNDLIMLIEHYMKQYGQQSQTLGAQAKE